MSHKIFTCTVKHDAWNVGDQLLGKIKIVDGVTWIANVVGDGLHDPKNFDEGTPYQAPKYYGINTPAFLHEQPGIPKPQPKPKSKLQTIREHAAQGKGSQKMINYLLFYISVLEFEISKRKQVSSKDSDHAVWYNDTATYLASMLRDVDMGTLSMEEFEAWFEHTKKVGPPKVVK